MVLFCLDVEKRKGSVRFRSIDELLLSSRNAPLTPSKQILTNAVRNLTSAY